MHILPPKCTILHRFAPNLKKISWATLKTPITGKRQVPLSYPCLNLGAHPQSHFFRASAATVSVDVESESLLFVYGDFRFFFDDRSVLCVTWRVATPRLTWLRTWCAPTAACRYSWNYCSRRAAGQWSKPSWDWCATWLCRRPITRHFVNMESFQW